MKECFKNWVLTHEKLYKLIVFVLALFAFLAVTAHGCKTMKAEAATSSDGKYYPCLWSEVDWGQYESYKSDIKSVCTDFIIQGDGSPSGYYCIYLFNEPHRLIENVNSSTGASEYRGKYLWFVGVQSGLVREVRYNDNVETPIYYQVNGSYVPLVGGTYDFRHAGMNNVSFSILPYEYINEPAYLVNAPYFSHVSTEVQNPILLKNAALEKMYTEVQFKLMGQPMTPSGGYGAEFFVDVYLPSIDFLHDMVYLYVYDENTSSSLHGSTYSEFQYKLNESYQNWWLNVSRGKESYKKFTLRFTQTYEHPIDGNVLLNLPHDYLLECIEAGYGSVEDMYLGSITSDKHIYEFCYPTLLKFMTVGQVGNIVHTYNYPDVYYGRYTTITYKANLSEPVITEYNNDYYATGGSDSVDKVVQEEINNAYNDIADKLQSDNQALQDMLDAYYRGENAFSDYNSSDVWSFLSDTTKGLVSVLPTLSGLAAVVGVVFGFLPIQISGMIMTLFVICIFTAIIRFIRG